MRKILFIDHEPMIGGSTVSLGFLLKYFSDRSWSVDVTTPKNERERKYFQDRNAYAMPCNPLGISTLALDLHFTNTVSVLTWQGIVLCVKNVIKLVIGIIVYYRQIRRSAPQIVYVNEYVSIPASIAAFLAGVPCVMHIRSLTLTGRWGIRRKLLRSAVQRFNDLVIPISRREAEQFAPWPQGGVPRMIVIGEFLGTEYFHIPSDHAATRKTWNLPLEKKIVLMLGGMSAVKGTLDFLRSAQSALCQRDDFIVLIAGKEYRIEQPAYCAQCDALLAVEPLKGKVRMLGVIPDIIPLIACCDMVVSSNVVTHFSRPVLEAWSQGKPVIATATAHNEELIADGIDGLLVPVGNPEALAAAMIHLIDDNALAHRLGRNGRTKALRDYEADAHLEIIFSHCMLLALQFESVIQTTGEDER